MPNSVLPQTTPVPPTIHAVTAAIEIPRQRGPVRGVIIGLVTVVLVTAFKLTLFNTIGEPTPFLLYFGGVMLAAWYGGVCAGLLTTAVTALLVNFLFLGPKLSFTFASPKVWLQLALFVVEGVTITLVMARLQRERRRSAGAVRDVTDQRRHEASMRLGREWFSTALRSIGDAVITTDRQSQVTFLNPVATALTGWTLAEAIGKPLDEVFVILNETSRQLVASPVDRVLREGIVVGLANHTLLVHRAGHETAIDDSAAPIRSDSGAIDGVVLVFRDVSVKRRDEQRRIFQTRATQELNSSLDYQTTLAKVAELAVPAIADWCAVDMLEDDQLQRLAVAHVDPAKIAFVEEIERRYPTDPNAPSGVPNILRTGKPELVSEIPPNVLELLAQNEEHLQLIQKLALRSYIGVPIKRGEHTIGVITFVMAESKRLYGPADLALAMALADRAAVAIENSLLFREVEQAHAEAAKQRDRLYGLVMAAPVAIAVISGPDFIYELVNQPFEQTFGGRKLQGLRVADLDPTGSHTFELRRVCDTGVPYKMNELAVDYDWHNSGQPSTRYFSYTAVPLPGEAGQVAPAGVMVFTIEVTEQVVARHKVEEARQQAEHANRAKDEFLAMLGHELRNPLAPILTALQLMHLRADGALERERNVIERQVKHVVRLVDDLLDISRITRGKVELSQEPVLLAEVVAKAIEMASPLIEQRGHQLTVTMEPGLVVLGDPVRLAQVVANLLNNAAKYTEKGGHIVVRGERQGGVIVLAVRDSGIGITPDMLTRVFELFAQERQAIDRAQGGLGLGLAIVRSLVTLHGGTVTAHSGGPGLGSEFTVRLPALEVSAQPSAISTLPARSARSARNPDAARILVVDDNVDAMELLSESLELLGHETVRATDAVSALHLAAQRQPEVALLDIGLPVMDGYELGRRLREITGLAEIKLVAITGYGQESDRARSVAAGFNGHLVKPVSIKSVQQLIMRLKDKTGTAA